MNNLLIIFQPTDAERGYQNLLDIVRKIERSDDSIPIIRRSTDLEHSYPDFVDIIRRLVRSEDCFGSPLACLIQPH